MISIKTKLLIFFTLSLLAYQNVSAQDKRIESPDGFFQVSLYGIYKIKITGSLDTNGAYPYNSTVVRSKYPKYYKKGSLVYSGWWHPNTQQFFTSVWQILPKTPQCSLWTSYKWSFSYSLIKVSIWKNINSPPNHRMPQSYCLDFLTYPDTCQNICEKWVKRKSGERYIVKSKKNAIKLFDSLK